VRTPENEVLHHHAIGSKGPALVAQVGADQGLVLVESLLIGEYLEQFGGAPGPIPKDKRTSRPVGGNEHSTPTPTS